MQGFEFLEAHLASSTLRVDSDSSATYLHALIENSPIAIVVLDAAHRYTMCNPAFMRLFQFSPQELASSDLDNLIAAPEMVKEAVSISQRVVHGEKVHTITQRRRKDGMIVDVEIYGVPLIVQEQLVGVYGLYQDVTERNQTRNAIRHVTNQLENVQQEERRRIARDLHDSTSQELAVLNWNLRRLAALVEGGDETVKRLVQQTKEMATECSERIRSASYLLHPPFLGEAGLVQAIRGLAEGFEQRSGIRVYLNAPEDLGRFSNEAEVTLFRIVQEGLANVLRHSDSPVAHITLDRLSGWLQLTVADEGKGRSPICGDRTGSGVGLSGMRERLERLGGMLTIDLAPTGTTLIADLPLEEHAHG